MVHTFTLCSTSYTIQAVSVSTYTMYFTFAWVSQPVLSYFAPKFFCCLDRSVAWFRARQYKAMCFNTISKTDVKVEDFNLLSEQLFCPHDGIRQRRDEATFQRLGHSSYKCLLLRYFYLKRNSYLVTSFLDILYNFLSNFNISLAVYESDFESKHVSSSVI